MKYGREQIAQGLIDTALNNLYDGNVLRVAKDFPEVTQDERNLLDNYMNGRINLIDHIRLQEIAFKIRSKVMKQYWEDNNGNKWTVSKYSETDAERLSKTLINCTGCIDCISCENCVDCEMCEDCSDCKDCEYCTDCNDLMLCTDCKSCCKLYKAEYSRNGVYK